MELWHIIFWAVLTAILIISEICTVQMVAIWFAAGSLLAFISSFFQIEFYIQVIIFIAGSLLLLFTTRPFIKKFLNGAKFHTNADSVIGKKCVVKEEINNLNNSGRVFVDGLDWAARSTDNEIIFPVGAACIATEIQGVKLIVRPMSEED